MGNLNNYRISVDDFGEQEGLEMNDDKIPESAVVFSGVLVAMMLIAIYLAIGSPMIEHQVQQAQEANVCQPN